MADEETPAPEMGEDVETTAPAQAEPADDSTPDAEIGTLREALSKANKDALRNRRRFEEMAERVQELERQQLPEAERALEEARAEGAREAQSKIADRLVRAEIRIAAAGKVAPEAINDLPALMGELEQFADEAGEIDTDRITAAIAELVETKPYLAPRVADAKPAPDPDQGAVSGGGAQLTVEQLKSMSPEEAYAAFREGRAAAAMGA